MAVQTQTGAVVPAGRYRLGVEQRLNARGLAFALPLLIVLAVAIILPAIYNAGLALHHYDAVRDEWSFGGLGNFLRLWQSGLFWNSVSLPFALIQRYYRQGLTEGGIKG